MELIKLLFAYILPAVVGYMAVAVFDKEQKLSIGFKIFTGVLVGIGLLTLQAFALGVFGSKLILPVFLGILLFDFLVLEALSFAVQRRLIFPRRLNIGRVFRNKHWLVWLLLLIVIVKLGASWWQVSSTPTYEFDAWNNWNLRAKVIAVEQQIPLEKDAPFYLGGGIKSYPLNDGLWRVWIAAMLGRWQESAVNTASVFYFAVLLGLFYFSLPQRWHSALKMLATYLLASLPLLYLHSRVAYADLLFSVCLLLAGVGLYNFIRKRERVYLLVSALGLALTIWTKNEGLAIVLPIALAISLAMATNKLLSWKQFGIYWLTAVLAVSPWLVFRFVNRLDILSGDSSSFQLLFNSEFLKEAFSSVFLRSHFNFLWLAVLLLIVFRAKQIWGDLALRYLAGVLAALFLVSNGVILFTDKALDLSALARVNLQLAPLALFFAGVVLVSVFSEQFDKWLLSD